ncbi:helix-turn-helix domain-containing protein [Streptomyces chrestomyceticus]|uniref:helix-turn-helix domain-containing protein n=1 Tax=Streptomyces chrestomyceticus TaxID=68185 RepID=UPI003402BA4E
MSTEERPETLADLIKRLKDEYDVTESAIARRIGVAPATVNAWVHSKRGTGRGPNPDKLRALAEAFPKFTEREIFAAAGRKVPGPVDDDAEQRILALYRSLTAEQQEMKEIEMRALAERNQSGGS